VARTLTCLHGSTVFFRCRGALWQRWSTLLGWKGIQVEPVCIIRHSSGLRKCIHSLTQHNWPEHWLAVTTILFFSRCRGALWSTVEHIGMGGTVSTLSLLALCHCSVLRNCVFMAWCSASGQNIDLHRWQYCFFRCRGSLWSMLHGWKLSRWSQSALCALWHDQIVSNSGLIEWRGSEHCVAFNALLFFQVLRNLAAMVDHIEWVER